MVESKSLRAEYLSETDLEKSSLFEDIYFKILNSFFDPKQTVNFDKIMLVGNSGSGKTFVTRKAAEGKSIDFYGVNKEFEYGFLSGNPNSSVAILDDAHYYSDICRYNELEGNRPNTGDFARTLTTLANKYKRVLLLSDRSLHDMACVVKDKEARIDFLKKFSDLATTSDDRQCLTNNEIGTVGKDTSFIFRGEVPGYKYLPKFFGSDPKSFRGVIENSMWRDFELNVRRQLNLKNLPVIFPTTILYEPTRKRNRYGEKILDYYEHCKYLLVPDLDNARSQPLLTYYQEFNSGLSILLCNDVVYGPKSYENFATICPVRSLTIISESLKKSDRILKARPQFSFEFRGDSYRYTSLKSKTDYKVPYMVIPSFREYPDNPKYFLEDTERFYLYTEDEIRRLHNQFLSISTPYKKWPKELFDATVSDEEIRKAFVRDSLQAESLG
jgi:hypothetical protein